MAERARKPRASGARGWADPRRTRANTLKAMTETPRYRTTFLRLVRFLWPYRVSLAFSVVLAIGSQAAALGLLWLSGSVVGAIQHGERHKLAWLVGIVLAIGFA